ncbi:MAG TPA: ABC transporter permease [Anaerolineae bacterium]|nr:ABC transporter permease [Anaerolineae bacterium]
MLRRTLAITRKEIIHILRDPRSLSIMFMMPVIQLILLGYTATTDVEHLSTAVLDQDQSVQSRELVDAYRASNYFDILFYVATEEELGRLIDGSEAKAGILIPAGYGRRLTADHEASIAFIIDGSLPSVATTAFSAAQTVAQAQSTALIERLYNIDVEAELGIAVRPRVWYNPDMKSANFMIPGLIAMILQVQSTLLTALSIAREKEEGTIEQLIVTPLRSMELIVGKVMPFVAVSLFNLLEVLFIGVVWFGVPVHGSVLLLLALGVLALLVSLGIGLLGSTVAHTQQEAIFLMFFLMLPFIFLSGFFFPVEAMPRVLQWISYLIPLRYLLVITRGIILKGAGITILWEQALALVLFAGAMLLLAASRFRKQL